MSVQVLGNHEMACMYCTTTDWAFGPVFCGTDADDRARWFLHWYQEAYGDPRRVEDSELESRYGEWLSKMDKSPGECFICGQPVYKGEKYAKASHNCPYHVRCADEDDIVVEEKILVAGEEKPIQPA